MALPPVEAATSSFAVASPPTPAAPPDSGTFGRSAIVLSPASPQFAALARLATSVRPCRARKTCWLLASSEVFVQRASQRILISPRLLVPGPLARQAGKLTQPIRRNALGTTCAGWRNRFEMPIWQAGQGRDSVDAGYGQVLPRTHIGCVLNAGMPQQLEGAPTRAVQTALHGHVLQGVAGR